MPAGQDLRGEGKEGWRGRGWSPERETAACTVAEKTGKGFDFLFFLM